MDSAQAQTQPSKQPVPDQSAFCESSGQAIHFEYFGRAERPCGCLVNGFAMETKAWYPSLPFLLAEFDVLFFDLPGQGRSPPSTTRALITEAAVGLARILDELRLDAVHVVGLSYGGYVAVEFTRLFPHRALTQFLSGIALQDSRVLRMHQRLARRLLQGGTETFDLFTCYLYEKLWSEKALRSPRLADLEGLRARLFERYKDRTASLVHLLDAWDPFYDELRADPGRYAGVKTPTLVVSGEYDAYFPLWLQRGVAAAFPCSRHVVIPEAGHALHVEEPERLWAEFRAFALELHPKAR